ncbi:hypothetical protein QR680_014508 [Steinernema hermaphroditum]|uniref:Uncharacterized protein n=1 Tax=Steinernema hermaphroditum TaxID=289476 RepID=A0AA39I929_9BILA|nr:hypothetical protein QR680_014508 [Steinernema hermaphroditum]
MGVLPFLFLLVASAIALPPEEQDAFRHSRRTPPPVWPTRNPLDASAVQENVAPAVGESEKLLWSRRTSVTLAEPALPITLVALAALKRPRLWKKMSCVVPDLLHLLAALAAPSKSLWSRNKTSIIIVTIRDILAILIIAGLHIVLYRKWSRMSNKTTCIVLDLRTLLVILAPLIIAGLLVAPKKLLPLRKTISTTTVIIPDTHGILIIHDLHVARSMNLWLRKMSFVTLAVPGRLITLAVPEALKKLPLLKERNCIATPDHRDLLGILDPHSAPKKPSSTATPDTPVIPITRGLLAALWIT